MHPVTIRDILDKEGFIFFLIFKLYKIVLVLPNIKMNLPQVYMHWDDPEGWYGEGGGRRVQDGEQRGL